jgi:hypothetical protein
MSSREAACAIESVLSVALLELCGEVQLVSVRIEADGEADGDEKGDETPRRAVHSSDGAPGRLYR